MSTPMNAADLTAALVQRSLLAADAEPPSPREADRPWFISVVLGFAGWLAGIFGLVFVWMVFQPSTAAGLTPFGVVLLAAAFGLYTADRDNQFFDQLALALSIAGQLALGIAATELTDSGAGTAALIAIMQVVLAIVMPNALARVLAAFFACIASAVALRLAWWDENLFSAREAVSPGPALLSWFLIWMPVAVTAWCLIEREAMWMVGRLRPVLRPVLSGLLLGLSIGTVFSEPFEVINVWGSGGEARATNWLSLWPLLDVATVLVAAWLAFRVRNMALVGVAIAAALIHVMQFYFLLGTTLLMKSVIMLAVGAVLLPCALALRKQLEFRNGSEP